MRERRMCSMMMPCRKLAGRVFVAADWVCVYSQVEREREVTVVKSSCSDTTYALTEYLCLTHTHSWLSPGWLYSSLGRISSTQSKVERARTWNTWTKNEMYTLVRDGTSAQRKKKTRDTGRRATLLTAVSHIHTIWVWKKQTGKPKQNKTRVIRSTY